MLRGLILLSGMAAVSAFTSSRPVAVVRHRQSEVALQMVQGQGSGYKKVFVAGGSKGTGRLIIDKLLASGAEVR